MADNNLTNIQAYQKKWHFNIGLVIFGVIFVYLTVTILMYLTENHVSAYEVREGSILRDNAYTGFILRNETIVQAEANGYVSYFAKGQKISLVKDNKSLRNIIVGLGWGVSRNLYSNIDCDASAILCKRGKFAEKSDVVCYYNLKHKSKSVALSGDNLTGRDKGDDEKIYIDLSKIPDKYDCDGIWRGLS